MLNFSRRWRIKIGIPEIEEKYYTYQCSVNANNAYQSLLPPTLAIYNEGQTKDVITPYDYTLINTIPSNAYMIGNTEEDGFSARGFFFEFSTKRSVNSNPTESEMSTLTIKNLPPEVVSLLNDEKCLVEIEAGYRTGELTKYYIGYVKRLLVRKNFPDIDYVISLQDSGFTFKNTYVAASFSTSDSVADVVVALAKMLGLGTKNLALEALKTVYIDGGMSFDGDAKGILNKLSKRFGFDYSVFNGDFSARMKKIVLADANYNKLAKNTWVFNPEDNNVIDIQDTSENIEKSESSGTKRFVTLTTFLTPITIDEFFTIPETISQEFAGTYKINELVYNISSESNFTTEIKGEYF